MIHLCPSCNWMYRGTSHDDPVATKKFNAHWKEAHERRGKREAKSDTAQASGGES